MNMADVKNKLLKSLHMIIRIAMIVDLSIIIAGSAIIFIFSIVQSGFPNAGESFKSSLTEHYGYNRKSTNCTSEENAGHRPMRYMFEADKDLEPRYEYCSWSTGITWWRCLTSLFVLFSGVSLLGILAKRSPASDSAAIWQDPKRVLKFLLIPAGLNAVLYFLLIIADGHAVNSSKNWCESFQETMAKAGTPIVCDYYAFTVVVLFDTFMAIMCGLLILLLILRNNKKFRRYMQLDEDDDLPIPLSAKPKKSTAGRKSKFSKFTRK